VPDGEVRAAYRIADVLALCGQPVPGKVEGFGLVLLEAAAQGLPAIVTSLQALPEVIRDSQTGWVCDHASAERLAEVFRKSFADGAESAMRSACIGHARSFGWDRCVHDTYARTIAEAA
jgi:glycosyltransferase involved in cell wall biosynthesis